MEPIRYGEDGLAFFAGLVNSIAASLIMGAIASIVFGTFPNIAAY